MWNTALFTACPSQTGISCSLVIGELKLDPSILTRTKDRVSMVNSIQLKLDSILDMRFLKELPNWNIFDYAQAKQIFWQSRYSL